MLEAHYAVPMLGAVLCSINIRLDAAAIGFVLEHSEAKIVLVDREFAPVMRRANCRILAIDIGDAGGIDRSIEYEAFIAGGDPQSVRCRTTNGRRSR